MAQPRFGKLLWQALNQVKAKTPRTMGSIKLDLAEWCYVGVAAVNNWKKRSLPPEETIERLARWGVQTAGMEREWLVAFLRAGNYDDGGLLVEELFGADESELPTICDNMPPLRSDFIGRIEEIGRVREGLTMSYPVISIEGIGGVGKTTLAIKVANMCKSGAINDIDLVSDYGGGFPIGQVKPFDAFVWISAKDKPNYDLSLDEVLDAIAGVLNYSIVRQLQPNEKIAAVDRLLRAHRTLVIIDNFETITDITLAHFLQRVPPPSKVIITTRTRQLRRLWDVPLYGLSPEQALQKIRHYSYSLGLRAVSRADKKILQPLIAIAEGNPKALEMALGYIKYKGMALDEVVRSLVEANENVDDLFQDLFARAWGLLSEEGQRLLMVMPFFADSASRDALEAAADVHGWYLRMGISQLIEMSLLETTEELVEARKRYSAHPLVIAFAGARLREKPEFEEQARERWGDYFLQFATQHLVRDEPKERYWNALQSRDKEPIDIEQQNLLNVLEWADKKEQPQTLLEMMMVLVHYMDGRMLFKERLYYAKKAAKVANKLGQKVDEALLRIDALAWKFIEIDYLTDAAQEIKAGLRIAQNLDPEVYPTKDLMALAYTFLARVYLDQDNVSEASSMIDQAISIDCQSMVGTRVYMIAGDVVHKKGDHVAAIRLYKEAVRISSEYGGDGQEIEMYYQFGFAYLAMGQFEQAEAQFKKIKEQGIIDGKYAKFGLAKVAQAKSQTDEATKLAQEVFEDLSHLVPTHRLLKQVTAFLRELEEC